MLFDNFDNLETEGGKYHAISDYIDARFYSLHQMTTMSEVKRRFRFQNPIGRSLTGLNRVDCLTHSLQENPPERGE
jgi:hypothetical protein